MSADEGEGFVIRDRRGRSEDRGSDAAGSPQAEPLKPGPQAAPQRQADAAPESGLPVTFSSFVFSLGTSALMLMGEQLDPRQPHVPVNLAQAKEMIDILSVLESKTKGNLTTEEQAVLDDLLYALRIKYVDLASGKPAAKSP
ncbi:MAG: DUF1844 domain-containing protein [Nitrospirota bacterium]|nr:DUF1844 domain-containing protein [Nitrospirota bacterium]